MKTMVKIPRIDPDTLSEEGEVLLEADRSVGKSGAVTIAAGRCRITVEVDELRQGLAYLLGEAAGGPG